MSGAKIILNDLYDKIDPENRQPQPFRQKHIDQALADLRALMEWPVEKELLSSAFDYRQGHKTVNWIRGFNSALKLCKEAFMRGMR